MASPPITPNDVWIVAATVWAIARDAPPQAQIAVMYTIVNRQRFHPRWQGKTLVAISKTTSGYPVWRPTNPLYAILRTLTLTTPGFADCLHMAVDVLRGAVRSPISRATHFHPSYSPIPAWAKGHAPLIAIDRFVFYEGIG